MKKGFIYIVATVLAVVIAGSTSRAQLTDSVRIAYVTSERTAIFAKTLGSPRTDTLFQSIGTYGNPGGFKVSHIAVLDATANGKSLLVGLRLGYWNGAQSEVDSMECFARLDSPYTLKGGFFNPASNKIGPMTILKTYSSVIGSPIKPLPLGVISPDGKQWYGSWLKTEPGMIPIQFFHGNFDASGGVDSVTLDATGLNEASGFRMTNIITNPSGNTMGVCVSLNFMSNRGDVIARVAWTPTSGSPLDVADLSGQVRPLEPGSDWDMDSAFTFALRFVPNSNPESIELGLTPNTKRDMNFYQMHLINGVTSFAQDQSLTLPHTILPDSLHMFTGLTGQTSNIEDDKEVLPPASGGPYGNGGDINFSPTGDSVVFVTCRNDDYATAQQSSIWIYDTRTNKSYFVVNDVTKMERQPIFMGHVFGKAPYVPGSAQISSATEDFGTVVADNSGTKSVTVNDPTPHQVTIKSFGVVGPTASVYTVTPVPNQTAPFVLAAEGSEQFNIALKSHDTGTFVDTFFVVFTDSLQQLGDVRLTTTLTGKVVAKQGSVKELAESEFSMSLVPNPFKGEANVTIGASTSGTVGLELIDVSGRSLWRSENRYLGAGERTVFPIEASSLALAPGSYYIVLHTPAGDVMRKAIVIQ